MRKVPDPYPLTLAGMLAALGPQAINFGISIGGGEAYLLPNIAARGTLGMHWLMLVSVILETALVYECIKYSICTGRSFFAATVELGPRRFWPWFWAVVAILTFAWPAWMGGAVIAAHRFTGIGNPLPFGPPHYLWAVIALVAVLVVFYFSNRTYVFLAKFFTVIMFANIVLVLAITLIAAKPQHYWQVLLGYLGITFLLEGYPVGLAQDRRAGPVQSARRKPDVGQLLGHRSGLRDGPVRRAGDGRAAPAGADHRRGDPLGRPRIPGSGARCEQWVKVGGYSLILWWAIIGGLLMTYLYSVAGLAYLHEDFLKTGKIPSRCAWCPSRWPPSPRASSGPWPAG